MHLNALMLDEKISGAIQSKPMYIPFVSRHNQYYLSTGGGGAYHVDKSASDAKMVISQTRLLSTLNSGTADSFGSETPNNIGSAQVKVSTNAYPQTPYNTTQDLYMNALYAFRRLNQLPACAQDINDFSTSVESDGVQVSPCPAVFAVRFNDSGITLNNTRPLMLNVEYSSNASRRIDAFVLYAKYVVVDQGKVNVLE